jgi:hypothetical protein
VILEIDMVGGTSNSSSFHLTGLLTSLIPARVQYLPLFSVVNNSTTVYTGTFLYIDISGTIYLGVNGTVLGWTASGTKGSGNATSVAYSIF